MRTPRLLAALLVVATVLPAQRPPIPSPVSILGFEPGTDRKLPTWKQISDYFQSLQRASPRVQVRTLGKTTLGRPFLAVFIADSSTIRNLERYRQIQRKLMDPRLRGRDELEPLLAQGKNVILITSSIHSTEGGGVTNPLVLPHPAPRGPPPPRGGPRPPPAPPPPRRPPKQPGPVRPPRRWRRATRWTRSTR